MAADEAAPAAPSFSLLRAMGWSFYLASSWTWCIGMFLPVLLVRDYGLAGFAAFALPNVIGAAAMGWVLQRGGAVTILSRHRVAVMLFSIVTVAFGVWFVVRDFGVARPVVFEFGTMFGAAISMPAVAAAAGLFGLSILALLLRRTVLLAGLLAWLGSVACAAVLIGTGDLGRSIDNLLVIDPAFGPGPLISLAPVFIFGFLLCPYLDATFLRARASTGDAESRIAFSAGFGVFFFAMILFTLGFATISLGDRAGLNIIAVHILGQVLFTSAVHIAELIRLAPLARPRRAGRTLAAILILTAVLALTGKLAMPVVERMAVGTNMAADEVIYRFFLSFYGLGFPAYVWLCMIPTRDGHSGPRRDKMLALAGAVGLAAPFFYMGFIERQTAYLGPGLLIVLLARLVVRALSAPAPEAVAARRG